LRGNIYALEEAGLIEKGDERDAKRGRQLGMDIQRPQGGVLDSSWLNARAGRGVEKGLREEYMRDVGKFLEREGIWKGKGAVGDGGVGGEDGQMEDAGGRDINMKEVDGG
jgi:hypothetical protein